MKNNLLGKNFCVVPFYLYSLGKYVSYDFLSCSFYLYRFRKYVSYGFPIINSCNPGVNYETPCIIGLLQRNIPHIVLFIRV
jgi:hypothetical protein